MCGGGGGEGTAREAACAVLLPLPDHPVVPAVRHGNGRGVGGGEVAGPQLDQHLSVDLGGVHVTVGSQNLNLRAKAAAAASSGQAGSRMYVMEGAGGRGSNAMQLACDLLHSTQPAPLTHTHTARALPHTPTHRAAAVQAVALAACDQAAHGVPQALIAEVVPEDAGRAGVRQDVGVALLHRVPGKAPVALAGALQQPVGSSGEVDGRAATSPTGLAGCAGRTPAPSGCSNSTPHSGAMPPSTSPCTSHPLSPICTTQTTPHRVMVLQEGHRPRGPEPQQGRRLALAVTQPPVLAAVKHCRRGGGREGLPASQTGSQPAFLPVSASHPGAAAAAPACMMPLSVMSKAVQSPPAAVTQSTIFWRWASWLGLGVPSNS